MTTKVEKSIQVDVPVNQAYNQWTQFEDFPHFMGGVKEVRQLTDQRLHWVAEIAGVRREWEAAILEQEPDRKVAWAATSGATNAGAVRFEAAGPSSTIVYLTLEYEPEGAVEQVGDKLGIVERQVNSDLKRFKELIEDEGYATGAWRGSVNENLDVGTPGVGDAAGVAAVAGVAAAAGAAVASSKGSEGTQQPEGVRQPEEVTVVPQPPADVVRDDALTVESDPAGYTAPSSTEGVEKGVRDGGDYPMIGGGESAVAPTDRPASGAGRGAWPLSSRAP